MPGYVPGHNRWLLAAAEPQNLPLNPIYFLISNLSIINLFKVMEFVNMCTVTDEKLCVETIATITNSEFTSQT